MGTRVSPIAASEEASARGDGMGVVVASVAALHKEVEEAVPVTAIQVEVCLCCLDCCHQQLWGWERTVVVAVAVAGEVAR